MQLIQSNSVRDLESYTHLRFWTNILGSPENIALGKRTLSEENSISPEQKQDEGVLGNKRASSGPNGIHKRSISQEENRPINTSTIPKAKKTKVQQIRSH